MENAMPDTLQEAHRNFVNTLGEARQEQNLRPRRTSHQLTV